MQKVFGLILLFVLCFITAFAEEIDYSKMSYEDLAVLKKKVDAEYYARPEAEPFILQPGEYIVGRDILPGDYYIMVNEYRFNQMCVSWYGIYANADSYRNGDHQLSGGYFDLTENTKKITLENDNLLRISKYPILFSVKKLDESEQRTYTIPEGTFVPAGIYLVGEDLPAGQYEVYMATLEGYSIYLYKDQDAFEDDDYSDHLEVMVIWNEHTKTLDAKDGNVVEINKDVIMIKQEKPSFD